MLNRGYKIAVADIFLQHKSSRASNGNINILVPKWQEKGFTFPITVDQFKFDVKDVGVEVEI